MPEVVLLAGGQGTRLRPLTYSRPKPLMPVANKALLDHVLASIPDSFRPILLPVNYLADQIRNHLETHPDPRVQVIDEPEPMGSGGALKSLRRHLTGPFLVLNADIVSSIDLRKFWEDHERRNAEATISLWEVGDPTEFGVVRLGKDDRITEFVEKPPPGTAPSRLINAGHYALSLNVLDRIPEGRPVSLEREAFTALAKEGAAIHGHRFDGYWVDCGRPASLMEAHRRVLESAGEKYALGQGIQGLDHAHFESYALGDGVRLGARARVVRSIVLPGAVIGDDAIVRDSILGAGVHVGRRCVIEGCVLADRLQVPPRARWIQQSMGITPAPTPAAPASSHPVSHPS